MATCPFCGNSYRGVDSINSAEISPGEQVFQELQEYIARGDVKDFIFCGVIGDGYMVSSAGNMSLVEELGLLEAAKADMIGMRLDFDDF